MKITRKTRTTIHRERVNPAVAERRSWAKFGAEKGKPKGPQPDTTSIAENMQFRPNVNWKAVQAEEAKNGANETTEEKARKDALKDKKVKCRICSGEHFTARCPYKETMAPVEDGGPAVDPLAEDEKESAAGGLGAQSGGYVPPHLRKGATSAGAGERMGGKYERDDLATLRVTNVSFMPSRFCWDIGNGANHPEIRFPKWQKSKTYVTCSNALAASPESSSPRTETLGVPRALLSFPLLIGQMLGERARKWTGLAIDISS